MGIIISRIRKKKSTIESLEKLEKDIKEIEENQSNTQKRHRKITKLLFVYSIGLYVLFGIIFYFQFNSTLKGKLLYLVISPLLFYNIKKIITWYFERSIKKYQTRLNEMIKEKKKILEEVMDKETYKVAKEILEKFSSETTLKSNYNAQLAFIKPPEDGLKKRIVNTSSSFPKAQPTGSVIKSFVGRPMPVPINSSPPPSRQMQGPVSSMLRLPAPILPLNRSYIDKVFEYLIGDGPNNRYALICSQCHSHNGMALKEEFEYIGFKCCYCFSFNPARKVRPEAPKLESTSKTKGESDSDSEKTSSDNSDGEHKITSGDISTNVKGSSETSGVINGVGSSIPDSTNNNKNETPEVGSDIEAAKNHVDGTQEERSISEEPGSGDNCDQSLVKS